MSKYHGCILIITLLLHITINNFEVLCICGCLLVPRSSNRGMSQTGIPTKSRFEHGMIDVTHAWNVKCTARGGGGDGVFCWVQRVTLVDLMTEPTVVKEPDSSHDDHDANYTTRNTHQPVVVRLVLLAGFWIKNHGLSLRGFIRIIHSMPRYTLRIYIA